MSKQKKVSKKSLEYVRPQPGTFTLEAFPGVEFRFQKASLDHSAWCQERFGREPYDMITTEKAMLADLCELYFHYLEPEFKVLFKPVRVPKVDDYTGEESEELLTGPRLFMQAITGGVVEALLISTAFAKTIFGGRSTNEIPDDLKKSLEAAAKKREQKADPQP